MRHDAIFLRLKMTKAGTNGTKIVVLAHSGEETIVRSEGDWEGPSWGSEGCWGRGMPSIPLCWINGMYEARFFFCLWAFVFSEHLEAQSCILSQQPASLRDAQDQYFVRREKLSWLLPSTRKAKTGSLIYTLYITLVWILLYEVELTDSTQSTLLVESASQFMQTDFQPSSYELQFFHDSIRGLIRLCSSMYLVNDDFSSIEEDSFLLRKSPFSFVRRLQSLNDRGRASVKHSLSSEIWNRAHSSTHVMLRRHGIRVQRWRSLRSLSTRDAFVRSSFRSLKIIQTRVDFVRRLWWQLRRSDVEVGVVLVRRP